MVDSFPRISYEHVEDIALETAETVLGVVGLETVVLEIAPETVDAEGIAPGVEEIVLDVAVEETGHEVDLGTVLGIGASVHCVEQIVLGLVEEELVELLPVACHRPEGELQLVEHWAHWLK